MTSELHQHRECALDNIFLLNGFTFRETRHGKAVSIEDIDGLHRAIGAHLARKKRTLTGAGLRFLRVEPSLSRKLPGMLLGKAAQTVARREKGRSRVDGSADRIVRVLYAQQTGKNEKTRNMLQELAALDDIAGDDEFRFEDTDEGWRLHSAA